MYDVIVVGAGVEGSAAAYHLAKTGLKTLLLEQFPLPHSRGSSHGQSRITRYAYADDFYTHMMLDAYPMWDTLAAESGVTLFKECGVLNLGVFRGQFLSSVRSAMSRHGLQFESLTPAQVKQRYPGIRYPADYGAILDPKGGVLMADRALAAFQSVFKKRGGELRDGEPVQAIIPAPNSVTVTTSKGYYRGKKVVIAAGPWAGKLLAPLGLKLPLKPVRITVCYWREKGEKTYSSDRFPCIIDGGEQVTGMHTYGLPCDEYPGHFKLCLHVGPEIDPDDRDLADDSWVREKMSSYVRQFWPQLHDQPGIVETCIYTNTPDQHPVIDRHPKHSNIIIAAGFSGHGFKLAPAVGKAVMEMVMDKPPSYQTQHFAVSRFLPPSAKL